MTTIATHGIVVFAVIFGGGLLGMFLGGFMPARYHDQETRSVVQAAAGMVSFSSALVLGLLVASAKDKFDVSNRQTEDLATSLMLMDRDLVAYGPEAKDVVALLRSYAVAEVSSSWPSEKATQAKPGDASMDMPTLSILETIEGRLGSLSPRSEPQRRAAAGASALASDLAKAEWLMTARRANHEPQRSSPS